MKDIVLAAGTLVLAGGLVFGFVKGFVTQEELVVGVAALGLPSPITLLKKLLAPKVSE